MAKRRTKKSSNTLQRRWQRLKKRVLSPPTQVPVPRLPHSTVFIVGVGIGLAAGLAGGLALAWLDGRHGPAPRPAQVAAIVPPKPAQPAPAPTPLPATTPRRPRLPMSSRLSPVRTRARTSMTVGR